MTNHIDSDPLGAQAGNEAAGAGRNHYLFQDADIPNMPSAKLLALIEHNIGTALGMTDGSDLQSDLRIDIAQDLIEQARDTLVARGHVFEDAEQQKMSFLAWPPTPEQERAAAEKRDRERSEDAEYRTWASAAKARLNSLFLMVMAGCELPAGASFDGVKIDIGWGSWTSYGDGRTTTRPSGAEVLKMASALIECGCTDVKLPFGPWPDAKEKFAASPGPFWKIELNVPEDIRAWELLRSWWHEHRIQSAPYVWYHEPIGGGQCKFTHWEIPNWPERAAPESWVYGHIGHLEAPAAQTLPPEDAGASLAADKEDERDDRSHYLFPDSEIPTMTSVDLLALIEHHMADALDSTDGTDFNSDVRIDYSQDLIEQARDTLVARGHLFSKEEQKRMHFLRWPLSPEEQAAEDAREVQNRIEAAVRNKLWCEHEEKVKNLVRALAAGEPAPADFTPQELELSFGYSGGSHVSWPGHRVIELRDRVHAATGKEPFLAYVAMEIGVSFEDQKAPGWKLCKIPVEPNPKLWEIVRETLLDRTSGTKWVEMWDYTPGPLAGFHCAIYDLFPIPPEEEDLALQRLLESFTPAEEVALLPEVGGAAAAEKSPAWSWLDRALRCWRHRLSGWSK